MRLISSREGRPVYYGRYVLIALFLAGFMVYGGGLYSFVLFIPPLTAEFGWTRADTSGLVTAFWLSAPLILFGGTAIRRLGASRLLIAGIVLEAACVVALAGVSSFWQMYALRAGMGLGKVIFAVALPYSVATWYRRRYSLGLGIVWAGWHVGGLVLALVTGWVIAHSGWRVACLVIALGLLTVGLVPVLLAQRVRSPAALGLGLDGVALADDPAEGPAAPEPSPNGSVTDVLRSPIFWLIGCTTLFFYGTYGGLLTHEAAVVEGAGFSSALATVVLSSTAGFAALGGLSVGWLLDHYSIRRIGIAMNLTLLVGAASLLLVEHGHLAPALWSYSAAFGVTIGGSDLYFVALLRERFPNVSIAYSYSAWYFCEIITLLCAGPAAGHLFDLTGNYDRTLALLAASAAIALLLTALAMPRVRAPEAAHG